MKIAMIGQKGIPAHSGGVEQHVDVLARELVARGHEVNVYCRRSYCPEPVQQGEPQWPRRIFRPTIPTKHLDAITHSIACTADVLFRDVDLVHYHAIGPAALAPLARLGGLPVVVTVHGLDWQRAKWGRLARRCLRLGELLAALSATRLVVVSQPLREYFAARHGVRAIFIPNGVVPIARRAPARIRRWGLEPGRFVLAVARLVPEKGLHYLIRAFATLTTDLRLVIAGGGGLDAGYEQQLHAMADDRVVFTGNADRELLAELYSSAALFVLPSEIEGMSIALLEAMSCGVPVLVSDIPENACVVADAGLTFRSADVTHLADVLGELLAAPRLLPEWGRRAAECVAPYRWSAVVDQLEAVYRSCLRGAGPRPVIRVAPADEVAEPAGAMQRGAPRTVSLAMRGSPHPFPLSTDLGPRGPESVGRGAG